MPDGSSPRSLGRGGEGPPAVIGSASNRPVPIRRLFCISNGVGAALLDRDGSLVFWSPPGFDGELRLASLLDPERGASLAVTPVGVGAPRGRWGAPGRVLEARWLSGARLRVAWGEGEELLWLLDGAPGGRGRIRLRGRDARGLPLWNPTVEGAILRAQSASAPPLHLSCSAPVEWPEGLVTIPEEGLAVRLSLRLPAGRPSLRGVTGLVLDRLSEHRHWWAAISASQPMSDLLKLAPELAANAVTVSLATIASLQDRATGLVVASPTTSIPQWPGGQRAWDYRYAWLRDNADAGVAMTLAGDLPAAARLGEGLAQLLRAGAAPVRRLNGGPLPPEMLVRGLRGYGGAAVRIGNAAAEQAQVDTLGEVCRFAELLDRAGACPPELLEQIPALADAAAREWTRPDHGIWEVRGPRLDYTHSKLLAWTALDRALTLTSRRGLPAPPEWDAARLAVEREVGSRTAHGDGRLAMAYQDSTADAATLAAYLVGYPLPGGRENPATLDYVLKDLGEGPLLVRHRPERDEIPEPCLPFIFPAFWAAVAEELVGRHSAAVARFRALCALAGPAGQLSEVADPVQRRLLGNFPQIQSHAALVEAAFRIWGPDSRDR